MMNITFFNDSPDAGLPECVCSFCGEVIQEEDIPIRIRVYNLQDDSEARFHFACFEQAQLQVQDKASGFIHPITVIPGCFPAFYRPPFGTPLYWRDEVSGILPAAVMAYLDNRIKGSPIAPEQLLLLKDYLRYHISAPCWDGAESFTEELAQLREDVERIETVADIGRWIGQALEIAIDPL